MVSRDYKLLPVIRCVPGTLPLGSQGMKLTPHLHVISRFTLCTAIPALPHYAFMVCRGNITFTITRKTRSRNANRNTGKFIITATQAVAVGKDYDDDDDNNNNNNNNNNVY